MSLAIQITTHAPRAEVEALVDDIRAMVAELDRSRGAEPEPDPDTGETPADERRPASTWRIFGNDYSDPQAPQLDVNVSEASLEAGG